LIARSSTTPYSQLGTPTYTLINLIITTQSKRPEREKGVPEECYTAVPTGALTARSNVEAVFILGMETQTDNHNPTKATPREICTEEVLLLAHSPK
jgi:hypothetical protein